jgi:putative endopeptidase
MLAWLPLASWHCGRASEESQATATKAEQHDVDRAGMDRSVNPGDDFFRFANGAWLNKTEIPPDRSSIGVFSVLSEQALQRTRELLEKATANPQPAAPDDRKIGDYYASYLDESAIEAKGIEPLADALKTIAAIGDRRALADWIGRNLRADVDPLNATNLHTDHVFGLWVSQDFNDPTRYVPYLLQGGLGLPDRAYYLDKSPRMEAIRSAYRSHIKAVLKLAGVDDVDARAARVFDLEERIANVHWTRVESEDVLRANNPWTREDFSRKAPGLDWSTFFAAAGLKDAPTFIVWQPSAIAGLSALIARQPLDAWRDYLTFSFVNRHTGFLPRAFVEEGFALYGKVLAGTPQLRDRWKRAVDAASDAMPEAVGRIYAQRYFPPQAKARLQTIVKDLQTAFARRIDNLTWMDPKTKANAKAKLGTLIIGIGYPDTWRDYSKLEIVRGDAFGNAWRAELFDYQRNLAKLGQRVDRTEWWIAPQTVNALNLPVQNALNFPAAILEPPFFDPAADTPVQYGSIGGIIGHEVSHSFDDQGSQFDATGKLANWWTQEDLAHFKAAAAKLVEQYNGYQPFSDMHVNGQQTLGENIADLAGLSAAFDAYRAAVGNGGKRVRDGLTDDQRFFISYAQSWRSKAREPALRQRIQTDGHAPDEYRADTVRNLDAWYDAFGVKPSQRLYLAPDARVRVW